MDTQYLNLFLILVIVLLIVLNFWANYRKSEGFQVVETINNSINDTLNRQLANNSTRIIQRIILVRTIRTIFTRTILVRTMPTVLEALKI